MNTILLRVSSLAAYITIVAVNYLAVTLPLGGRDTGEISDNYPNLFTPAGYAFSIWGLIYTLLGIYVIYQLQHKNDQVVAKVNRIFILNAVLNVSWLFAWHYDFIWLSAIIMTGILLTLIRIADILRNNDQDKQRRWLMRLPFSIYFGWITVAMIANIVILLVDLGWNGFGLSDSFWTVLILFVGAAIGSLRMLLDRFFPYGLVLIWAYGAILSKHLSVDGFSGNYPSVIWAVALCLLIFAVTILFISIKKKNTKLHTSY